MNSVSFHEVSDDVDLRRLIISTLFTIFLPQIDRNLAETWGPMSVFAQRGVQGVLHGANGCSVLRPVPGIVGWMGNSWDHHPVG